VAFKTTPILKRLFAISLILLSAVQTSNSQINSALKDTANKLFFPTFYLSYYFAGLGSNMGSFAPTIKIKNWIFLYTYEQNSYWSEKNYRVDTVCIRPFRQNSIDSIIDLIKDLKDTTIHRFNHCIMSGGIHFMAITNGIDTTKFDLMNTFDYTALKIINILNEYVPTDKKLWANEQMIKDAEDCWANMMKRIDADKKKKKIRKKKNAT